MKAHVMAWYDPTSKLHKALIDIVYAEGGRSPGGAAQDANSVELGNRIIGTLATLGFTDDKDIQTTMLGEMSRPSFAAVRASAALQDMQGQGAV